MRIPNFFNEPRRYDLADADRRAAERAFDEFCEWLVDLLRTESEASRHSPSGPAASTSPPHYRNSGPAAALSDFAETPGRCPACGAETLLPVLCVGCLEHLEELPAALHCPWYVDAALCAAEFGEAGGNLMRCGCGGELRCCERPLMLWGGMGKGEKR